MSNLFSCQSVSKAFGAQTLFTDLSFVINSSDRVGLIGPNGSGKSTLLKIICGLEEKDRGSVLRKKNMVVSYLAQEDRFSEKLSPVENLLESLRDTPLEQAEKINRVQAILSRAELQDQDTAVSELSGGWRKRVSICRSLVVQPDLLVMDEPTNHLDIEGIVWLEKLLAGSFAASPSAFIMVSHDRRFLENSINRVVELSATYPTGIFQVSGTYSKFLEKRQEFLVQQDMLEERLANKARRETEWLRRGPKARTTKARYRIDEAYRLQDELAKVRTHNRAEGRVAINFTATGRKTKKLLETSKLSKGYGDIELFSGLDMILSPGSRIGLVGRNGCGKSTLMNILASGVNEEFLPDSGTVSVADGVSIIDFKQDRTSLDQKSSLRRALAPEGDAIMFRDRSVHVVSWAKRFLFRPDQLETPVGSLSGGEQARILIADLMRQPADILLLDEPTNDLDIGSRDVLEESLLDFGGAVVLVSHDRYLLDRVCDCVLGFTGDGEVFYYGDYRQWLADLDKRPDGQEETGPVQKKKESTAPKQKKSGRLSYLDQREYELMDEKIMEAEETRDRLEKRIHDPALAAEPERLQKTWLELEQARNRVDLLYDRWDELEEKKQEGV
jgi:ATP-binding cassette subfamily F protein uup